MSVNESGIQSLFLGSLHLSVGCISTLHESEASGKRRVGEEEEVRRGAKEGDLCLVSYHP